MVNIPQSAKDPIRDGLASTAHAIRFFRRAILALGHLQGAKPIAANLELTAHRLDAMWHHVETRMTHDGQDALFIGLNVLDAGLASLADGVRKVRQACGETQPPQAREQGWFTLDELEPEQTERAFAAAASKLP